MTNGETPKLSEDQLEELRKIDSATIANAITKFDARDSTEGYASLELRCMLPEYPPTVGYAITCTEDTASPRRGTHVGYDALYRAIDASPKPVVVVFKNVGPDPLRGLHLGDMMATLFQRLGAVATVTDAGVRDLAGIRERVPDFQVFAKGAVVAAGSPCLFEIGVAVSICGLTICPGDLLHGDEDGLQTIPLSIADKVAEQARKVQEFESEKAQFMKSDDFTLEAYLEKYG